METDEDFQSWAASFRSCTYGQNGHSKLIDKLDGIDMSYFNISGVIDISSATIEDKMVRLNAKRLPANP